MKSVWIVFVILLAVASPAAAQWVTPPVSAPRVQQRFFQSVAAGTLVSYHVYTPPAYDAHPERRFPVLFWLHGFGAGTSSISPLSAWFDNAIARGDIPPMIVVFPNGLADSMWCDSFDGDVPMETVVITELLPAVDASLRTVGGREGRIIEGFSMGGYGAGRMGFRRSDLFAGVSMLGAGPLQQDFLDGPPGVVTPEQRAFIYELVYGSDPVYFLAQSPWLIAQQNATAITARGTKVRMAVGTADPMYPDNVDMHAHLDSLGIVHSFTTPPGVGHQTMTLLTALGPANGAFYRSVLREPDLDGDGLVGAADLAALLGGWGGAGMADVDGDGVAGASDLAALLGSWGERR